MTEQNNKIRFWSRGKCRSFCIQRDFSLLFINTFKAPFIQQPSLKSPLCFSVQFCLIWLKDWHTALRVRFFGRIQKRICDPRSYGFFTTKRAEDPKKNHLPWQRLSPWEKTNTVKTKRKSNTRYNVRINMWNVCISVGNTKVSRIEYTP